MKKGSTIFLKVVLCLMGAVVVFVMLWFPRVEGRNINADNFTIYFKDPFLAYVYLGTTPFFFALFQAFKLLTYIEQKKTFSQLSVNALRNIKYCAVAIIVFIAGALAWIRIFGGGEDSAGAVVVGLAITFITIVVATFAGVLQKLFQNAVDLQSENDLTV